MKEREKVERERVEREGWRGQRKENDWSMTDPISNILTRHRQTERNHDIIAMRSRRAVTNVPSITHFLLSYKITIFKKDT